MVYKLFNTLWLKELKSKIVFLTGLALKKGNPWLHKLSLEILTLHENGDMEDLDQNWILLNNTNCQTENSSPSTLGLTNMAGK